MEKERLIFWFIYTNDGYTNEAISRELSSEDTVDGVECSDGITRKLWKCDGQFVTKILKNKKQKNFDFEIFKKEGKHGSIQKASFLEKKKKIVIQK